MDKNFKKNWEIYILLVLFVFYIDIIYRYKSETRISIFRINAIYECNYLSFLPIELFFIYLIINSTKKIKVFKRIYLIILNVFLAHLFFAVIWLAYMYVGQVIVF